MNTLCVTCFIILKYRRVLTEVVEWTDRSDTAFEIPAFHEDARVYHANDDCTDGFCLGLGYCGDSN